MNISFLGVGNCIENIPVFLYWQKKVISKVKLYLMCRLLNCLKSVMDVISSYSQICAWYKKVKSPITSPDKLEISIKNVPFVYVT